MCEVCGNPLHKGTPGSTPTPDEEEEDDGPSWPVILILLGGGVAVLMLGLRRDWLEVVVIGAGLTGLAGALGLLRFWWRFG